MIDIKNFLIFLVIAAHTAATASNTCDSDGVKCASRDIDKGLKWHEFDWQNYITKDKITVEDTKDRTKRFGLNFIHSMKIGVNRTIDDNRQENNILTRTHGFLQWPGAVNNSPM